MTMIVSRSNNLYRTFPLPVCVYVRRLGRVIQDGFRFQLTGRLGKKLLGGEDAELTMALRLSGWRLRIDRRLRLQHFMPSHRLRRMYLRRLRRGCAASHVFLEADSEHSLSLRPGFRRWLSERCWYQFGHSLGRMASQPNAVKAALFSEGEGRNDSIEIETAVSGRALGLLQNS